MTGTVDMEALIRDVMPLADRLTDEAFEEGYLQALLDARVVDGDLPVPAHFDDQIAQRLAARRQRRRGLEREDGRGS